jgi:type II secretory pathway pseudopilin PulG
VTTSIFRNAANRTSLIRQMSRRKQGGYLLVELALVLAISTILLTTQFSQIARALDDSLATATGDYMAQLQGAVNNYAIANNAALKSGAGITGFNLPLQPTITELKTANFLNANFSTISPLRLPFQISMSTVGTCPSGVSCKIKGYAFTANSYVDLGGQLRSDVLSTAVLKAGVQAGMSLAETPALITSPGGGTAPNPAGGVPGVLAIAVGDDSGLMPLLSQYYKADGTSPLTGAMNANNNDINNVNNLNSNGRVTTSALTVVGDLSIAATASPGTACPNYGSIARNGQSNGSGLVICSAGIWQQVGNVMPGIGDGVGCSSPGQIGSSATGVSFVCNGSYWTSMNVTASAGDACAPAGRTSTSIATREELVCKNGVYVRLVNLIAKSVEVSRQLVVDGITITKPACDTGGTAAYSFHMTQTVVDVSVVPPRQALYIAAVDNGGSWTVKIRLKDNSGGDFSASPYNVSAVMKLECSY